MAVTWLDVPQYNTGDANTFQIELFYDGRIAINYLVTAGDDGIAGLSWGGGVDPEFLAMDLSALGVCEVPDCNENEIPDDQDIGRRYQPGLQR